MGYNINFEFLDEDAIENAITCLNYEMDKVIFFGEQDLINEKKRILTRFLTECCSVGKTAGLTPEDAVIFEAVSETSLEEVIGKMREVIKAEEEKGNNLFFDITGGEGMTLLAFGILSREQNKPMHLYDVESGQLREFFSDDETNISVRGRAHKPKWDLDVYVKMQGGEIDENRGKSHKIEHSREDVEDTEKLWAVCKQYRKYWNSFSTMLAYFQKYAVGLTYVGAPKGIKAKLDKEHFGMKKVEKEWIVERESLSLFKEMLLACKEAGLLTKVEENHQLSYTYKNEFIQNCMCEAGNALEQHVFLEEKKNKKADCRMGVHINWENKKTSAVLNEIDVLVLQGYIPVFISCKAGSVEKLSHDDLYELETVAQRFGGKYAKKVLAIMDNWQGAQRERAKDMGIEVRVE